MGIVKAIQCSNGETDPIEIHRLPKNVLYQITSNGAAKGHIIMLTQDKAYGLEFIDFTSGTTFSYPTHPPIGYDKKL